MSNFAEVSEVLETYFDGLYHADASRLAQVFHPKAVYATADETPLLHRDMDSYLAAVAQRVSPAAQGQARQDHIDTIEFAGENTAMARVRCAIGERQFTDFLTLVRDNGTWRIMAKVFQIKIAEN